MDRILLPFSLSFLFHSFSRSTLVLLFPTRIFQFPVPRFTDVRICPVSSREFRCRVSCACTTNFSPKSPNLDRDSQNIAKRGPFLPVKFLEERYRGSPCGTKNLKIGPHSYAECRLFLPVIKRCRVTGVYLRCPLRELGVVQRTSDVIDLSLSRHYL